MAEFLGDISPGDAIPLAAAEWNAYKAAARAHIAKRFAFEQGVGGSIGGNVVAQVLNSSGSDVGQFAVMGIDTTVAIDPDDALNTFRQAPIPVGKTPDIDDHFGRWCVTLEPIKDGTMGLCLLAGLVAAQVEIADASHGFCDVTDADGSKLTSDWHGAGRILFKNGTSGTRDCLVLVGHVTYRYGKIKATTKGAVDSGDATYTVDNVVVMRGASPVSGAAAELTVQNTFGDDIDDDATITASHSIETDTWETDDVTCPA